MMYIKINGDVEVVFYESDYNYCENLIIMDVLKNEVVSIEKYVFIILIRDYKESELLRKCEDILNRELFKSYDDILNEYIKLWNKRWESVDVKINGDKSS